MERAQATAEIYDFAKPDHKLRCEWPVLDIVSNNILKDLKLQLSNKFKFPVSASTIPAVTKKYAEYLSEIDSTQILYEITVSPMSGVAWICIDRGLIYSLVDSFFGGSGSAQNTDADRALSHTEKRICQHFIDQTKTALANGWSMIETIEVASNGHVAVDRMPKSSTDPTVVECQGSIGFSGNEFSFRIVYSYDMLRPYEDQLSTLRRSESVSDSGFSGALTKELMHCEIDMRAVLAESRITLAQLLDLQAGDFIPLRDIETVTFKANSKQLFSAKVGRTNGHVSACLSNWCLPDQA